MGLFSRIAEGLRKTKESISKKFYTLFTGKALDDDFYDALEVSLLSSDVGGIATEKIIDMIKEECYQKKISQPEDAVAIFKNILKGMIEFEIEPFSYPLCIMLVGVNGVGKTTAIGKLASYFTSQGKSVLLAAADTFRAAAAEQLSVWADRNKVRLVKHEEGSDAAAVVFDAISSAKAHQTDVVLVDTAGRLHNKKNLMEELGKINRLILREYPQADYRKYIVLDATTGQNGLNQVDVFNEFIDIDGIVLTKLDGTAKGGVVIAICEEKEIPVTFIGVGEGKDDLLEFNPQEFVDGII